MPAFTIIAKRTLEATCVVEARSKSEAMRLVREGMIEIDWLDLEECNPPVRPKIITCEAEE